MRRRKIIDFQMKVVMPEVCYGTPDGENQRNAQLVSGDSSTQLRGLPVSVGQVRGLARVISTLQEAADIKEGDILVVPYTDVGWTPYFPLLGGLVTEKGGLLSHGAVVAREYGLPCVVGCVGATAVFRTGDNLLLNASRGTVELITSSA